MTIDQQQIAIAEYCGWKSFPYCVINGERSDIETWISPEELEIGFTPKNMPCGTFAGRGVPYYCSDLNEMHEAEKVLPNGLWTRYCQYLCELGHGSVRFVAVHQPASQRAEAFLRTIGKWID